MSRLNCSSTNAQDYGPQNRRGFGMKGEALPIGHGQRPFVAASPRDSTSPIVPVYATCLQKRGSLNV